MFHSSDVMKGYSCEIPENSASARLEDVNASYKDLAAVCGRIRNKKINWALPFLEKAASGEIPVLYTKHNKRLGHRRELGGRKGRYPKKAVKIVLKVLKSAIANGRFKGLGEMYTILAASANKKHRYPRIAPKGRWARSFLETSEVQIVLLGEEIPKGVEVTPPAVKKVEEKKEAKKEVKKEKGEKPKEEKRAPPKLLKKEGREHHEHKHEAEKAHEHEKRRKEMPHQHGENDTR